MGEQNISNEAFFKEIETIKDISILRDVLQFYQNEYSNFFSDANNLDQKITSLFNLSAIFLGYFLTVIIFLIEHGYFSFLKFFDIKTNCNLCKIVFVLTLTIGLILLFIFTCKIFKKHKVSGGYERIKIIFPVIDAYEDRTFRKDREKEFLMQMIYNSYKIVRKNYLLLDEKAKKLVGQHDKVIIYVIMIMISLLFIIFG